MKNTIASFSLFTLLIVLMIFSTKYVENKSEYYSNKANILESIIVNESWKEAYNNSMNFLEEWKKDSNIIPAFINHSHIETISNDILKLTQYIKNEDKVDCLATIHEVKFLLEEMVNSEKVTLPNVF
ncbi:MULTISPECIES: DUF4363 family protein [Clostridium]|uniref:DUF4363 domain-containing protein n=1 Tax=Clostridium thermopalmarium DSM 5974 TaxID=1121340 RepID=A0A2T0AV25_9CLOT|nr:DUF4363 family protein [Clostridium thermopalmarium]PRR74425.1 hypothetical protein CPAL_09220 [Clostridium thermopalmarium DSM 5974]PVZ21628.1 uncharacterized protein DUF4363 [Clostridium thermopalmarium DSM 5974]